MDYYRASESLNSSLHSKAIVRK